MPVLVQPKKVSNSTKLFLVIFEVLLEGKDQVRQKAFHDFLRQNNHVIPMHRTETDFGIEVGRYISYFSTLNAIDMH